jgi:hypothetical protein
MFDCLSADTRVIVSRRRVVDFGHRFRQVNHIGHQLEIPNEKMVIPVLMLQGVDDDVIRQDELSELYSQSENP